MTLVPYILQILGTIVFDEWIRLQARLKPLQEPARPKWTGDGGPAGSASLNEPVALAMDIKGKLYVADQANNRVRMIDAMTGTITTIAGTGDSGYNGDNIPAIEAGLAGPSGLAIDADGNLYIADTFNGRIRRIDAQTGNIDDCGR